MFTFDSDQYITEFLEDGGVLTLIDILNHAQIKDGDKAEVLGVLLIVSNTGRKCKEFICESHGKITETAAAYMYCTTY